MTIRISKGAVFPIVAAVIILGALWFGSKGQEQKVSGQKPQTRIVTPVTRKESTPVREIDVVARQFEFEPNPIRVKLGEEVILNITSRDVPHGFSLPAFGINQTLPPGETVSVQFQATQKGKFPFACSVACGEGHANMRGSLIVE